MIATTSLNHLIEHAPSITGWDKLLHALGKTEPDDEPLSLLYILETIGLDDALWALCSLDESVEAKLFALRCVWQEPSILTSKQIADELEKAELYFAGESCEDATLTIGMTVKSTQDAKNAVHAAVFGDAWTAAWAVARHRASSDEAVIYDDEGDVVWAAGWNKAREEQEQDFRAIFCTEDVNRRS